MTVSGDRAFGRWLHHKCRSHARVVSDPIKKNSEFCLAHSIERGQSHWMPSVRRATNQHQTRNPAFPKTQIYFPDSTAVEISCSSWHFCFAVQDRQWGTLLSHIPLWTHVFEPCIWKARICIWERRGSGFFLWARVISPITLFSTSI